MSENKRSFWSSIPGLVTGLAGLLTGIVGLVTVLIQLDVIGGDDPGDTGVATTVPQVGAPAGGGGGTTPTTEAGRITVNPMSLKLAGSEREKELTVRNDSVTTAVTVLTPQIEGDRTVIRTDAGCTNIRLEPGRTCRLKVLFAPTDLLKSYAATVVLRADGAPRAVDVPVDASALLPR